jgi:hypothetical protein
MPAGVVGGATVSLGDVEHVKLRGAFDEPKLHACIVCASASCPNLRREAFVASRLRAQMDDAFGAFMANPTKGLSYGPAADGASSDRPQLRLSRIMLWFAADFGGAASAARCAIGALPATHELRSAGREAATAAAVKAPKYFTYSWSMNRTPS